LQKWLDEKRTAPIASYLTAADKERITSALFKDPSGLRSPLLWYTAMTSGTRYKDDQGWSLCFCSYFIA
jgi:hypothetical protein